MASSLARIRFLIVLRPMTKVPHLRLFCGTLMTGSRRRPRSLPGSANNGRQLLLAARTEHSRSTGTDGLYGVAQLALSSGNASACTVRVNPDFTSRVVKEVQ